MASSINAPRTHLIMGLCLPLAVLLGYFVAQPLDSISIAVVFMVLAVLCVPLFMKWHHPLLIVCWNTTANPLFLPGRPALWMLVAIISLFFAIMARSLNSNRRFVQVPTVTRPLLFLAAVVVATALVTGGVGIRALGSDRYGGRNYFYILAAVMGYFAFTSHRIPTPRAGLYVAMFFLSGLTSVIGDLAFAAGPHFYFLTAIFVPDTGLDQTPGVIGGSTALVRLAALPAVEVDPLAKESAWASTEWRVEMWKQVLPQIPKYLIKGKGYAIDPGDLFLAEQSARRGFAIQAAQSMVAGDYHNGPLSVLIPFGIFGAIGFMWLLAVSLRVLYYHYRFGDPSLQRVNTFLLAYFAARILFFLFIFGSLTSDLYALLGMLGLSISLNGAPHTPPEPEASPEALTVFPQRV